MSKYIDHIFYINLDKRTDRKIEIESQLNAFGLSYERFSAIETPGQGIVGCGLSHTAVLKLAKECGYRNILILEDDFEFLVSKDEFELQLTQLFEHQPSISFDVCMLSYNLHLSEPHTSGSNVVGCVKYAQTASAYIVNAHYYDMIIQLYEWAIPLLKQTGQHWIYANDVIWRQLQTKDKWVYFLTRVGRQSAGYSDNAQSYQNHGC
jgi:glycosyl transferase family 25